jgi:hypothetical protein
MHVLISCNPQQVHNIKRQIQLPRNTRHSFSNILQMQILIVEDSDVDATLLLTELKRKGYALNVEQAAMGQ